MQTKCPYCFGTLVASVAAFACLSCPPREDAEAAKYRGSPVQGPPVIIIQTPAGSRDARPTSARCPTCKTASYAQACPDCHATLPPRWLDTSTTCIALAGTTYSGKSVYIGVAVKQLQILATMLGSVLTPFNGETATAYAEHYEHKLYVERGLIGATPRQNTGTVYRHNIPLMYQFANVLGRPQVLVLRDIAGENLADPDLNPWMFRFFARADGIVYLVDPLQIDLIRNQLRGFVPVARRDFVEPVPVLANLSRLLLAADPSRPATRVRLALTLSKFDALQNLREVDQSTFRKAMSLPGAAFLRDPSLLSTTFDSADSDLLNLEIESLLRELRAIELLNLARQTFQDRRWFAVSALGHQPGDSLGDAGITPFRCLDPIKWILKENGVLRAS